MKYILVIDEGTTSTRSILFDEKANAVRIEREKLNVLYPKPGWAECDADEIWEKTKLVMQRCVKNAGVDPRDILSIGMTAQRESAVVWERATGKPVFNCILWQDKRTDEYCQRLSSNMENLLKLHEKTGLVITSFFPAVKVSWILDHVPGMRKRAERGELCFGTVDTWLIYNMTGRKRFVAEQSNAARTQLYNINTFEWDDDMLEMFDIPKNMLAPEVLPSDAEFGKAVGIFDIEIPIRGSLGDQQAATLGQQCIKAGEGKISLGTSGLMSLNIGASPSTSLKIISTLGWNIQGKTCYHYETGFYVCGGMADWLQGLGFLNSPEESAKVAESVPDTAGVKIIGCFFGLAAPEFVDNAKGLICGLTPTAGKAHLVRAAMESIAYQTKDCCSLIDQELKALGADFTFKRLAVDGGVSNNDFVMQFIADLLNLEVYRNTAIEATALGAFFVSAISSGIIKNLEDIKNYQFGSTEFERKMDEKERRKLYNEWKAALNYAIAWGKNIHEIYITDND